MSVRQPYLVFGRDQDGVQDGEEGCWWPIWVDDGPQLADCAEAAIATVLERLMLLGENHWLQLAAVPAMDWTTVMRGDPPEAEASA